MSYDAGNIALSLGPSIAFALFTYIMYKKTMNKAQKIVDENVEKLKKSAIEFIQSDQCAKVLYQVGGFLGSGIMQGTGIQKQTGKFSLQNMFGQVLQGWIQNRMPQVASKQTEETIQETEKIGLG